MQQLCHTVDLYKAPVLLVTLLEMCELNCVYKENKYCWHYKSPLYERTVVLDFIRLYLMKWHASITLCYDRLEKIKLSFIVLSKQSVVI